MALFFDARWFDARLTALGLSRADVARLLGLPAETVSEMWKDQREISPREVVLLAALLDASEADIASRAGVSTRAPGQGSSSPDQRIAELDARVTALEARVRALSAGP